MACRRGQPLLAGVVNALRALEPPTRRHTPRRRTLPGLGTPSGLPRRPARTRPCARPAAHGACRSARPPRLCALALLVLGSHAHPPAAPPLRLVRLGARASALVLLRTPRPPGLGLLPPAPRFLCLLALRGVRFFSSAANRASARRREYPSHVVRGAISGRFVSSSCVSSLSSTRRLAMASSLAFLCAMSARRPASRFWFWDSHARFRAFTLAGRESNQLRNQK